MTQSNNIKMENNDENINRTNLIINYLPQAFSDHEFKRLFEKIGPVVSAKIIRNRHTNYSYGFGFVEFHDPENAQKAIDTLNGYQLGNKKIKVAFSRPHSDDIKRAKLYVKNIPSNMTVEQLNQFFGKYGTIIQSRLLEEGAPNSTNGQKNKGVAFILYDLHEQAEKAIESLNGFTMPGATAPLDIKFASTSGLKHENGVPKNALRQGNQRSTSNPSQNRPRNAFHHNNMNAPQQHHNNFYDNGNIGYNNGIDGYNYYNNGNSNLYGGPIRNNFQYGNKPHHNTRYNPLNNASAPGQQLDYNEPYSYDSAGASNGYGYGGPKAGFHPNNNNFNPQFAQTNGRVAQDQSGFTLFVYNIGTTTDEQTLRNLFTKFGHVLRTNVIRKGSESKGFGFVAMSSYRDALNAIQNLNGHSYNGKQLQVSFKK